MACDGTGELAGEREIGMRIILEAIAGPHSKMRIMLAGHQKGTFGRTEWADYQFPADAMMSSKHFSVESNGRTCLVRDLGSSNGTFVNEERVVESALVTGCIIRAGQTKILVTLEDVPSAARAPAASTGESAPPTAHGSTLRKSTLVVRPEVRMGSASSTYQRALADDDLLVRRAALLAAAWARKDWVLDYCRSLSSPAMPENCEALLLLAILGQPVDLPRILDIGRTGDLGPRRFQLLGAYGHPEVMNDLIVGIENKDPAIAVAAGNAFAKITGVDVSRYEGAESASKQSSQAGSEQVALDGSLLPSSAIAAREWRKLKSKFSAGQRWVRGLDVSRGLPPGAAEEIDLESRWEACLRGRFEGTWKASQLDLEQLANRLSS